MSTAVATETHAVFAVVLNKKTEQKMRLRVAEAGSWDRAQAQWRRLDNARLAGRFPQVLHFVVRSLDDPAWAPAEAQVLQAVLPSKGHKNVEDAARKAWALLTGNTFHVRPRYRGDRFADGLGESSGVQGRGGWFYWPNGVTAAQGRSDLARVAKRRNLVQEGTDGRWYVTDSDFNADTADIAR
jgi:hypothetical protein